jgi:hypothetical protein
VYPSSILRVAAHFPVFGPDLACDGILHVVVNAVEISIRWRGAFPGEIVVAHEAVPPLRITIIGWISRDVGTKAKAAEEGLGGNGSEHPPTCLDQPKLRNISLRGKYGEPHR